MNNQAITDMAQTLSILAICFVLALGHLTPMLESRLGKRKKKRQIIKTFSEKHPCSEAERHNWVRLDFDTFMCQYCRRVMDIRTLEIIR